MTGEPCHLALDISEHLFRLTTESVRLHSNATQRYQTLEALLAERVGVPCPLVDFAAETIQEHLTAVPTPGSIRVDLTISRSSADNLEGAKAVLSKGLDTEISLGDTLSIMLFHYVVGQKTTQVLQRIGFEAPPEGPHDPAAGVISTSENVVQLR